MSNQINKAFVQQFSDQVHMLAEQKGSKLLGAVDVKKVVGKSAHFDRIGNMVAQEKTSRHAEVEYQDTPHSRRTVVLKDFYTADLIDDEDEVRMLIDPRSPYAIKQSNALGHKADDLILAALTGNATATDADDATSNVSLPTAQVIDEGYNTANSHLIFEKVLRAKKILDENDVDMADPRYLVTNAEGMETLLGETEVTSADYNTVRALVRGEIDSFLGFKFIMCNRLVKTGESDFVYSVAFTKSSLGFAMGRDIKVRMSEIPDRHYALQVHSSMTGNAVRKEEERVVAIECDPA